MSREREIFLAALDILSMTERQAFVESSCPGDSDLAGRVLELLKAHEAGPGFLDVSPVPSTGPLPPAEQPGSIVGRYELLEQIGEGGFGAVYLAEQREPVRRKVALKIIKLGMDTRQVVARFEAERQALALMDHPHIAKVFDAGATDAGRPYFVMELVPGTPMTRFCDDHQANTEERLQLFMQVCSAIQHAHQKGIIHRDIKPTNVLITLQDDRPVPKVIDFGIAKATQQALTDITIFTRHHEFLGTPAYMSPEQTQLGGLDIDTRTDIYSLGVLLYELLASRTPFDAQELLGNGHDEMCSRIREQEPLKPSSRLNTLSADERILMARRRGVDPKHLSRLLRGDLDWIVMKALEKDRARRYESSSAFAQDIRRYLNDEPVMAAAPSVGYRMRKFARRHRRALPVAAAFVTLLIAATAVSTWLAWQARREAQRARIEASTAEAVTRFLNEDLFAMARPEYDPEPEVTLRSLLDRASQELPGALSNQPLVAAAIHGTLGRAYSNLGRHETADLHLQKALGLYQRELGERDEKTVRAMLEVAGGLEARGHTTPALPAAEKARDLALAEFGPDHPLTIRALDRVAWNYALLKRRDESLQSARQAWEIAQRVLPFPETAVYSSVYLLARHHGREGRFEQGEALLRQAWQAHELHLGTNHARTFRTSIGLAAYYLDHRQKLQEAERLNLNALEAQRRLFGDGHRTVLTVRNNLALLYEVTGRFPEALAQVLRVLEWNPTNKGYARDAARLATRSPLPGLESVARGGQLAWRYSDQPELPGWRAIQFDDASWPAEFPVDATNVGARCRFELTAAPNFGLAVKIKGTGSFDLHINGMPAISAVTAGEDGSQFAVFPRESLRLLEVGQNVITLRGQSLAGSRPAPAIEILVMAHPAARN